MVLTNQLIYLVNVKTIFQIIFASEKVRTLLKKQTLVKTILIGSLFFPVTVFLSIPFNKLPWSKVGLQEATSHAHNVEVIFPKKNFFEFTYNQLNLMLRFLKLVF